ncbi:phospholipase D-like domain-containing protein [Methanobacterium sp. ACI-7]|uniref:phospholipase D-like domain-containing protein n=1 Tax=unclassified Methanobacterium TaxID=2627676 RepID=UPI0039C4C1D6
MLFKKQDKVTEFVPTFLKEDRSALRKIHEIISRAKNHIYIIYPWITLGEEFIIPFENALSINEDIEVYLITKLEREDVFRRLHQLEDVERWKTIFKDNMSIKYNNNIHAKMIIVDDKEMIVGSSNLTGSGLGSSREYEGKPQIEANIYTNGPKALKDAVGFFVRLWSHKTSNEYKDNEYVLSCKSYGLSGIYQRFRKDFENIVKNEEIEMFPDGTVKFRGILAYRNNDKAYIIGKNRKDIAIKFIGNNNAIQSSEIGEEVEVSGKPGKQDGFKEFTLRGISTINQEISIKNLKSGLSQLKIDVEIIEIENILELETKTGKKRLTLVNVKDNTGDVLLELWDDVVPEKRIKSGIQLEIKNAYTKLYNGEIRLGLQKHNGQIKFKTKR